ncbi:MAG: hypothetical protein AAFR05_10005 [Bacteroidota bacterium]
MKIRWLILLFYCSTVLLPAQRNDALQTVPPEHACGTPDISDEEFLQLPWVGDNDKLYEAIRKKEARITEYLTGRRQGCNQVFGGVDIANNPIINVPVYFYVYRESGETGLPSITQINTINAYTNSLLASSGSRMRLSIHCIRFPISTQYVEIANLGEMNGMMQTHRDGPGINVHVVRSGYGWSGAYNPNEDAIVLLRSVVTNPTSETYAHEVGHFFTLPHTHKYTNRDPAYASGDGLNVICRREAVTRDPVIDPGCFFITSHCSQSGDGFCDTPADPTDGGCIYNGTWVDFLGAPYVPDEDNIMSYYDCRSSFSPSQVAAMRNNLLGRLNGSWGSILNGSFVISDAYEPNNSAIEATPLSVGLTQIHTLHDHCNYDEDWFVLTAGQSLGFYTVRVEQLANCDWPVWTVEVLYENSAGNLVNFPGATVSQINGNFVINVSCQDATNNELFVKVNDLPGTAGYYQITMIGGNPGSIAGPASFCGSAQYEVLGIPLGASVMWNPAPGLTFSCQACNPTTVQSIYSSGVFTLSATVTYNGCQSTVSRQIVKEPTTVPPFAIVEVNPACYETFGGLSGLGQYRISSPAPDVTYRWATSKGFLSPSTGTYVNVSPNGTGSMLLKVTATGTCGQTRRVSAFFNVERCEWQLGLDLHPNPAREVLRIAIADPAEEWGSEAGPYQIIVNDVYGKVLYRGMSDLRNLELDVARYREGVYTLRVLRNDKYVLANFVVSRE